MNHDEIKEFTSEQEITIKITATPEQHSMLKEWSAITPTLYMLDICVVGATKLTKELLETQPRKASLVDELRYLDRPNNCFSYLFALMEKVSDSRGKLTQDELKNQILADISALREFFKEARVYESDNFLIAFLAELMGEPIEIKRADYLSLLESLNNKFKLQNSISPKQRLGKAKEIILEAKSLSISAQHPIVTIALACLYGNKAAKKLMKFKADPEKFDPENALADISLIARLAKIKLEIEHHGRNGAPYKRVTFITDDNGLDELIKCFKPKSVKHKDTTDGRESEITMTVELEELLTEAEADEYTAIYELLFPQDESNN